MRAPLASIAALLTLAGCAVMPAPANRSAAVGQDFILSPGQSMGIEGSQVVVAFESVAEDSRCARDVTCIWEGNARVRLRISGDDPAQRIELNTSGRFAQSARISVGTLILKQLEPQPPVSGPEEYLATLHLEAAR